MKNFIIILISLLSITTQAYANNVEGEANKLIVSTSFDSDKENVSIIFDQVVNMVQVFGLDGEMEMMFPVGSKEVVLGMSLFDKGIYN